jgi:ketosteroid isomerase-like protein
MRRILTILAAATTTVSAMVGCASKVEEGVHPNEKLLRDGYEAFNRKDMQTVMGMFSDDITFVVPGRSIQAGTFKGKSEVGRYFSIVGKHTGGTHRLQILDLLADDGRAFLRVRAMGAVFDSDRSVQVR